MIKMIIPNEDVAVRNPTQALQHSSKTTENMRKKLKHISRDLSQFYRE